MSSLALISPSSSTTSETSSNITTSTSSQSSIISTSEPCSLCDGCGATSESRRLRRCGRCKAKWYCSQRCQKEDWDAHQYCCSRLPAQLETWRGNKTSAFGADYFKRVELANAWAKAPYEEEFCLKHTAFYQLVAHEKKSPFRFKPRRKVTRYEIPAYLLVSMIRVFLMHDISSVGKAEVELVAKVIDSYLCIPGGLYVNGAKTISIPDKLSAQEYLNLAQIWPPAFALIVHVNPEYKDALKHSDHHWKIIEVVRKKIDRIAFGPLHT